MTEINLIWSLESSMSYVWFHNLKKIIIQCFIEQIWDHSSFAFGFREPKCSCTLNSCCWKASSKPSVTPKMVMWHSSSSGSHKLTFFCRNLLSSRDNFFFLPDYSSAGLALGLYHIRQAYVDIVRQLCNISITFLPSVFLVWDVGVFFSFHIYWRGWRIKGWEQLRPCSKMRIVTCNITGYWWDLFTTALLILLVTPVLVSWCGACSAGLRSLSLFA